MNNYQIFKNAVGTDRNMPFYLVVAGIFILMKFGFTLVDTEHLVFLLEPTNTLVELLTGSRSDFLLDSGYYHPSLGIMIDKSCSGVNFWLLSFLVLAYLTLRYLYKHHYKFLTIPLALICTYVLTIFVNASRIFASIVIQTQTKDIFPGHQHIIHEAIGIITNLTFLILAYILIEKLLIYKRHHEKFA